LVALEIVKPEMVLLSQENKKMEYIYLLRIKYTNGKEKLLSKATKNRKTVDRWRKKILTNKLVKDVVTINLPY
jgi:hypothetical protein